MKPRNGVGTGLALAEVAVLSALVVVVLAWRSEGGDANRASQVGALPAAPSSGVPEPSGREPSNPGEQRRAITARTAFSPRTVLFGDTVQARVDVVVDRARIDPDSVKVAAVFSPWEIVEEPEQDRRDAGEFTHLQTTYTLRCLSGSCLSPGQAAQLEFVPARIAYGDPRAVRRGPQGTIRIGWPVLAVYSRYATASFDGRAALATPWRAELVALPAVSSRAAPRLVLALLASVALGFAVAGAALVYAARPRRVLAPPPMPEPEPPPRLSPLQQALALLEDAARSNGAEDRRRSLELVAEALAEWGDEDLARAARNLAWSEHAPAVEHTSGLATRVRATLDLEEQADAEQEQDEQDA